MAPWPPKMCAACGTDTTGMLAIVSDPFRDYCYGLCQNCLNKAFQETEKPPVGG